MKKKFFEWSWILMVVFFILTFIDFRFGVLALICMAAPLYFSLSGKGKVNCNSYCPRGSFLNKFMSKMTLNRSIPKFMLKKEFKNAFLATLFLMFGISLYRANGDLYKIGFSIFRMISITTIISILLGFFYKPRTWCAVCPMGHLSGEITAKIKVKK